MTDNDQAGGGDHKCKACGYLAVEYFPGAFNGLCSECHRAAKKLDVTSMFRRDIERLVPEHLDQFNDDNTPLTSEE